LGASRGLRCFVSVHLFACGAFWLRPEHESRDQQRRTKKGCGAVEGKVKAADLKGAGAAHR